MKNSTDGITRRKMMLQVAPAAAAAAAVVAGIVPAKAADRSRNDPGPGNPRSMDRT
jgi:hypothetical protein